MLLENLTWPTIRDLSKDMPVVIPIAAIEQHGHHLPVSTDSRLLAEIVRRVEVEMHHQFLMTPLMWYGNSHHHMDFAGTLSAAPRVYLDTLVSLLDNLIDHGFRRIFMLNGHGGNDVPGKQAVYEVRQRLRQRSDLLLLFATYWSLGANPQAEIDGLKQSEMGHACEWETSMMLRIAPELVGDYRQAAVEPGNAFVPATRAWVTQDRSQPGHIGWPQAADKDKGEKLFALFSGDVQQMLKRMMAWDGKSWEG